MAKPSLFDPLRAAGRVGESLHPWFYERLSRPRRLRQPYIRTIRSLSAAGELPAEGHSRHLEPVSLSADVLVVGGGPAGMGAAIALAASGRSTLVVEAEGLGGSWLSRRAYEKDLLHIKAAVKSPGISVLENTTCLGLYEEEGIAAAVGPRGPVEIRFEVLVVATGAYDRPLLFEGNDLPGIIGLRAFETYAAQRAFRGRNRIGIFGAPSEIERALSIARDEGISPAWMASPGEVPSSNVRTLRGVQLQRARGRRAITSAEFSDGSRFGCDFLVIGFSQPTWELAAAAGAPVTLEGVPPIVLAQPNVNDPVVIVGQAAGDLDPRTARENSEARIEDWVNGSPRAMTLPQLAEQPTVVSDNAFVCLCEDVRVRDVRQAVEDGFTQTELLKRRTGISTGPCQGKLCMPGFLDLADELGVPPSLPTTRPPLRPVPLAELGGVGD